MEKIKVQYLSKRKIVIPRLKSRGRGEVTLPLKNIITGEIFPLEKQILEMYPNELADLQRAWGKNNFVEIKPQLDEQTIEEIEEVSDEL